MNILADAEYIINQFLYGSGETPADLTKDELIRGVGETSSISVVGASDYMSLVGRFALPSQFQLIEKFFTSSGLTPKIENGQVTYYTKLELNDQFFQLEKIYLTVRQFEYDDGSGDYAYRTLIWNSGAFKISDDAQFWIDADGTKHIENFAIVPLEDINGIDENFDLDSDSIPTEIMNTFYLQERMDPYNIGRKVNIDLVGTEEIERKSYNSSDYLSDVNIASQWISPSVTDAIASVQSLLDDLHGQGIISPIDTDGRPYIYGTTGNDNISRDALNYPYYANSAGDGLNFVGGAGLDTVSYNQSPSPIKIYVDGDVLVVGGDNIPSDHLYSVEKVIGTSGKDYLNITGNIDFGLGESDQNLSLTIDANGGQGANPRDTINISGLNSSIIVDIKSDGTGKISDKSTNGYINLIGFHTNIIGSAYDDEVIDQSTGSKHIAAGAGDDTVSVSGTTGNAMIDGGDGDDTITGGSGNDVLIGGIGSDTLNGGAGSDMLIGTVGGVDSLYGDGGHDLLVNGRVMEGGAGNDIIDARGFAGTGYGATVKLSPGDGNDWIMGDVAAGTTGVDYIDLTSFSLSSSTIYWDGQYTSADGRFYEGIGTLSVVTSGGASISMGNVRAGYYQLLSGERVSIWIDTPNINFSDGSGLYGPLEQPVGYSLVNGSYSGAMSALSDYSNDLNGGDVEGTSGDDDLSGESGDDNINAGNGNDDVSLSGGNDTIDGGQGNDALTFFGSISDFELQQTADGIRLMSTSGLEGTATVKNVERFYSISDDRTWSFAQMVGRISTTGNDNMIGTDYDDDFFADAGDDTLKGFAGNDILNGGDGVDQAIFASNSTDYVIDSYDGSQVVVDMIGNEGANQLYNIESIHFEGGNVTISTSDITSIVGTVSDDSLTGSSGRDAIRGLTGNDVISAGGGDDVIFSTANGNIIDGGSGSDVVFYAGYASDFTISANSNGSVQIHEENGGTINDILTNVERLYLHGEHLVISVSDLFQTGTSGADILQGSAYGDFLSGLDGDDQLSGDDGNDRLVGGAGADTLSGGAGTNVMTGGIGDDIYYVDNATDNVVETDDQGTDQIFASVSYALTGRVVETLTLTGAANINAIGNGRSTTLNGNSGDNILSGLDGSDTLNGGNGNDVLNGGNGNDALNGGDQIDTATYVDASGAVTVSLAVTSAQNTGGAGTDTLSAVENLIGSSFNDTLTGNTGANALDGGTGDDVLNGGGGNDVLNGSFGNDTLNGGDQIDAATYVDASAAVTVNLTITGAQNTGGAGTDTLAGIENLTGSSFNDTLTGNSGSNILDGGAGSDLMVGGTGDDVYYVDATGDIVTEQVGEGTDEVVSSISYALGQNIENLILSGTGNVDGTGNDLANKITGNASNNILGGGAGDDILTGGAGADTMSGGLGNDIYYVDNVGDNVIEADSQGTDQIFASVSYSLTGRVVETLTLTGYANIDATGNGRSTTLNGNSGNNILSGLDGSDTLNGGDGNDVLNGGNGNDQLNGGAQIDTATYVDASGAVTVSLATTSAQNTGGAGSDTLNSIENLVGSAFNDTLTGNAASNVLDGGAGSDTMIGGAGDDIYYVDVAGDVVTEQADAGTDEVRTSLASYTVGANVENLVGLLTTGQSLTGNSLNNRLTGGSGADTLAGGLGDDVYYVDNVGDNVVEADNQGTDQIFASVSYSLTGRIVETLTLTGSANIDATGNGRSTTLNGNTGNNTLSGLDGNDVLNGGAGDDVLNGGNDNDTASYDGAASAVTVNLSISGAQNTGGAGTDTLVSIERLIGSAFNDSLTGDAANNRLKGGAGDDTLVGGAGSSDVAVLSGLQASYTIATTAGVVTITDNQPLVDGNEGVDTISGIERIEFQGGVQVGIASPIILDLNGDGVTLVDNLDTQIGFDWDNDGLANQTGWVGADDGFLIFDRDGDGHLSDGGELSFTSDKPAALSDLDGLRAFDTNGDGLFSSQDEKFDQFKIWQDANANGTADENELISLPDAGVEAIDLSGVATNQIWDWGENITVNTGYFTRTDGTVGSFSDVALSYEVFAEPSDDASFSETDDISASGGQDMCSAISFYDQRDYNFSNRYYSSLSEPFSNMELV